MPKGIMYVETRPSSPDRQAEHDKVGSGEIHMSDVLRMDPPPALRSLQLTRSHQP